MIDLKIIYEKDFKIYKNLKNPFRLIEIYLELKAGMEVFKNV